MSEKPHSSSNGNSSHGSVGEFLPIPGNGYYRMDGAAPNGSGGAPGQGVSVAFVLNAIRQWWKVATPAGLAAAALAGFAVWYTFVPKYRAEAWLEINSRAPYVAFPTREDWRGFVNTQVQLIKSPLVLTPVVSDPQIAKFEEIAEKPDALKWVTEQLDVKSIGQSELYTVAFVGPNPGNSKAIVDRVVASYFNVRDQDDAERTNRVLGLLKELETSRKRQVEGLQNRYRELYQTATGSDPFLARPNRAQGQDHVLYEVESKWATAEVEREVQAARLTAFQEFAETSEIEVPSWKVEQALNAHEAIQTRQAALDRQSADLARLKDKLARGVDDPMYQERQGAIEEAKEALQTLRAKLRDEVKQQLESAERLAREQEADRMRFQLESYQSMAEAYRQQYEKKKQEVLAGVEANSADTVELEFAREDYLRAQKVYDLIAQRVREIETEQDAPARVKLRQAATVPTRPVESVPTKKIAAASFVSLLFPFGLAVLWEFFVRRVNSAQQVQEHAHLPVIGEIARLPVRGVGAWGRSISGRFGQDLRVFEESVDSLRTSITLSESLRDMRVLVVTSAANNEGKTSVSVQLAMSIARATGAQTLLIDGDMRSPDVHNVLQTSNEVGLAEVLAGEATLEEAIDRNWGKRVHVLPAGKLACSPHTLLGNGALKSLLDEVRAAYRYVVIDTPPVLAAGETLVLAKAADATLICAMRDVSRLDQVNVTHERLRAAGANPAGLVLNGVPCRLYAYRYGTYSYARD